MPDRLIVEPKPIADSPHRWRLPTTLSV